MKMPTTGYLYYSTSDGSSTATSSGDAIIRVDSNGLNPTTIASNFTNLIEAMALDQTGNRMFVLDNTGFFAGSATGNTIWSVNLSTGIATQIFTGTSIVNSGSSLTLSPALAYDSLNGEVYFTQAGILMKMGADGSNPTAITSSAISSAISGITLDAADNLAFVEDATTADREIFSVDLNTGTVTKIYQNTSFVMGTGLAYNSADGDIYFTQASAVGGPPNLYKIPSNPPSTLSSATLVASSIEGSSAAQITFNATGDQAYVRGITAGGTTINQVDLTNGTVSTLLSPSGQTGLSVIFEAVSATTLSTTPSPATVTLGPAPATLTDSALLAGGSNPTGTITFTLVAPGGATVDTETVAVNGNGTYTTPTGFTLPGGTSIGTYQWDATYSGDANNIGATEVNEQVTVNPATPTLATTAAPPTVSLGPNPALLKDSALLSGGFNPTGTITFTLIAPGGATVDTETVSVNGNGTYSTPTGFTLPSSATSIGTYNWDVTYSGDAANNASANLAEPVTVNGAVLSTTPGPTSVSLGPTAATLTDTAVLAGGSNPTGTITFTLFYNGGNTPVDTETVTVNGNGTYSTPTGFTLPINGAATGAYQWDATYSGDANNNSDSDTNNPIEQVTVSPATPTLSTTAAPATVSLGPNPVVLTDSAILAGGFGPTGTITFTLIAPGGAVVDTETVSVNGNGTYITPTGFALPSGGTSIGTYNWDVSYSGNANNIGSTNVAEQVTVSPATPTLSTTPSPATVTLGSTPVKLTDTADLENGFNPTGTITFLLVRLGGGVLDSETETVTGNGIYTTPTGFTLPTNAATGAYQWEVIYGGDSNNTGIAEIADPTERVTVQSNIITPVLFALNAATEETPIAANTTVATFSDANIADTAGSLTATIDWGDGTTTSGTVVGSFGLFAVDGGHTYRVEGNFHATATLTRTADNMKGVASGTVAVAEGPTIPEDFAGNGFSGVLWRQTNPQTFAQNFVQWSMNGANLTASRTDTFQGGTILPDASWNVLGTGDFNGDGKSDILWQHADGSLTAWLMNDSTIVSDGYLRSQGQIVMPNSSWSVAGTGDFDGDGRDDILWRKTDGSLVEWLMNGTTITSTQTPTFQGNAVSPDQSWSVVAMGDFNGDGHQDILWRNSNGSLQEWLMNGATITASQALTFQGSAVSPDSSWSVIAAGDFNGDGSTDLLWRQSGTGSLLEWQMNGTQITSSQAVSFQGKPLTTPDASWSLVEIGDFNGDNKSDALWRQSTTGALSEWLMNGSQITAVSTVTSQSVNPMPDASWQVQSKPTNFV
jgi:hypothetical protein